MADNSEFESVGQKLESMTVSEVLEAASVSSYVEVTPEGGVILDQEIIENGFENGEEVEIYFNPDKDMMLLREIEGDDSFEIFYKDSRGRILLYNLLEDRDLLPDYNKEFVAVIFEGYPIICFN